MAIMQFNKERATKDGRRWVFYDWIHLPDGSRKKYMSKKYLTKVEAIKAENEWLLLNQDQSENPDLTFGDLYKLFTEHQKDKVKVTTFYDYKNNFAHLKSLQNVKVRDFNIVMFENWKKEMNKKKIATETKNTAYKFLKTLLNYADRWHDINLHSTYIKMENFNNPNEPKKEMNFYTWEEFKQFISAVDDLKYICIFETFYYCGLRRGELLGLQWRDIDFEKHTLRVSRNVVYPRMNGAPNPWTVSTPKTRTSERTIPIPKQLYDDLLKYKERIKNMYKLDNTWFIFCNIEPERPNTLNARKVGYAKKAGVKVIRNHDFRHSCASLLINSGASVALVAKYLGHAKIDETLNTYTHLFNTHLDSVVNTIDELNNLK